jgi:hypothetical protein
LNNDINEQTVSVLSIIGGFPKHAISYVVGFLLAFLSDVTTTSLALGSAAGGLATSAWTGVAIFFLGHTVIKIINATNGARIQHGKLVATAMYRIANIFESTQQEGAEKQSNPEA